MYGELPAFCAKNQNKEYVPTSFRNLYEMGSALSEALISMGLESREHVGLIADHRLEWTIGDCAILIANAIVVPRGTDVTEDELIYILNHSESKIVFVENDKALAKIKKVQSKLTALKSIILMDPKSSNDLNTFKLYDLIERGKELQAQGVNQVDKRIEEVKEDDIFTLIYTSGTTGQPKGVMLSHANMMHQLTDVVPILKVNQKDKALSILPVWHIFERLFVYATLSTGMATYFTNVRDLRDDFLKAKPTFMASAPRLWESIYLGIYNKVNDSKNPPIRKKLFQAAYFFSKNYNAALRFLNGNEVDYTGRSFIESLFIGIKSIFVLILTLPFNLILDPIVLSKIRAATGGQLRATCSGGGALQKHVDAFFNDIGLDVIEGYGMTETSPVIACRDFDHLVMGSVGRIVPRTEVQIRDFAGNVLTHYKMNKTVDGQKGVKGIIFVRGPQVMKGYYKNEEATKKVLKDGWMDTGDLGMINFKDTLTLLGRAKETIVLLGGENVEPVPIENKLCESDYISQCMVVGQDQKNLGAIIVPDFDKLKTWCTENNLEFKDKEKLIQDAKVLELIKREIKEYNGSKNGFKAFEQVTPFFLITKPFEVGEEITSSLKLKRHVVTEKYNNQIQKLYV